MNRTHLLILNIFLFSILSSDFLLAIHPAPANDTITMDILMFKRKNGRSRSIFRHQWLIKGEEVVYFLKKDKEKYRGKIIGFSEQSLQLEDKNGATQTVEVKNLRKIRRKRKFDRYAFKKVLGGAVISAILGGTAIWMNNNMDFDFFKEILIFLLIVGAAFALMASIWFALILLGQLVFKKTFKLNKKWQAKIENWQIGISKNSKGRASYFLVKRK